MDFTIRDEGEQCPACNCELDCYALWDYSSASEIGTECPNCGADIKITAKWSVTYTVTLDEAGLKRLGRAIRKARKLYGSEGGS